MRLGLQIDGSEASLRVDIYGELNSTPRCFVPLRPTVTVISDAPEEVEPIHSEWQRGSTGRRVSITSQPMTETSSSRTRT
jgi:hypothetical protein